MIPNNTCPPRITAAAGTKLAGASSPGTFNAIHTAHYSLTTVVYTPKSVVPHMALLRQTFVHCAKFPTAASRRSPGRISVPMWPITLSGRLLIIALVGHYPTNKLIRRESILQRIAPFVSKSCNSDTIFGISHRLQWLSPTRGKVIHVLLTRAPLG